MNANNQTVGEARGQIFFSLLVKEGRLKRGVIISRMHITEQTFAREYLSWLEQYPNVKYDKIAREFYTEPTKK